MHEALLTRGRVQMAPYRLQMQIFVGPNCVLVHPGECHLRAQNTDAGKQACLAQLLEFEHDQVVVWLEWMRAHLKGSCTGEIEVLLWNVRRLLSA